MTVRGMLASAAFLIVSLGTCACSSRDDRAATAAAAADVALQDGNLNYASEEIRRALLARDDVADYWLLSGRIALAQDQSGVAFDAFENAATLDRGNLEALVRLCQLAVSGGQADRAERYAEVLNTLHPGDTAAMNVQAAVAFGHGDTAKAAELIDQILKTQPDDPTALITRSRMLSSAGDYPAAARAAEASLVSLGDPRGRLQVLRDAYLKGGNAIGYRSAVARYAHAAPRSVNAQIDYAKSLYNAGEGTAAFTVTRRALAVDPSGVATAEAVLELWLTQGAGAMPVNAIVGSAINGSAEVRAAFAAYANALHRPDLALAALGNVGADAVPSTAVNDAKIARAEAQSLLGERDAASAAVAAVLDADPEQPRALLLRGRIRAAAGDRAGAVEDIRHALASSPANADARLALANLQVGENDSVLAVDTLRDGLKNSGADPRLAVRLAALLREQGRGAEADGVFAEYHRANPFTKLPT